ncbi:hypothetical protein MJM47_17650, partial [Salmonella enterica subsp. enterica serovar Cerro]|nr:hypothetical protein [Salmonella enterica subsp. enterica serovar Cerro]
SLYGGTWQMDVPELKLTGNVKQNSVNVNGTLKGNSYMQWTIPADSQGEEGLVEADNVDHLFMDTLLTLMAAHRVWSRAGKINAIPA